MKKSKVLAVSLGMICSISAMNAQSDSKNDSIKVKEIKEITVRGQSLKSKNHTSKIDVITINEIKNLVIEQPLRILDNLPGINVIGYGQGGVADQFSMRGFASGGHGGDVGVEIDGVSLNEAEGHDDGYADLNIIIPLNIQKVLVYKGPSSALHGRFAQGGTVSIETRKGGNYNDIKLTTGSYSTFDAQYAMGKTFDLGNRKNALKTNFAIQALTTDGYIKNSDILKGNISGRLAYQFSDKSEIAFSILGHRSNWNTPGYIPKDQYENKSLRAQPHINAENDGGRKMFLSERIDFRHKLTDNIKLLAFGYAVQQDFTRFAKFGYNVGGQTERFNTRDVFAFGGSLNGNTKLADKDFNWTTGLELYHEQTDRKRWESSFRKRGNLIQNREFNVTSFSVYGQGELDLHPLFRPSIGLRFDTFGGDYKNNDTGNTPTNSKIKNLSHFSPKLGFRSTLAKNFDFKTNISNGFSLPGSNMKYDTELKPVELWQYETGFTYNNQKNIYVDITGFILNSSREILERPIGSGEFINAGKTRRAGIEADTKLTISPSLLFKGNFTYTDTEIKKGDNEGKELTQLPKTMFNLGLIYTSPIGLGADVNFKNIADYYADDENTFKAGGYNVINLKLFYNFDKQFSSKGNVFLAINNLFNEYYAETIFGTNLFSASPTRNVSVGINYSF